MLMTLNKPISLMTGTKALLVKGFWSKVEAFILK